MLLLKNKYTSYLLLLLFTIPLFFLNIRDVHSWGDDFAQYIKEALNIAHGKPYYQSGYIYNPYNTTYAPPQYPPGYPLLLAPVVKIWGIAIKPMLYLNTVIAASLLFALFEYFRKQASTATAICLAVAITYSGVMVDLKGNILSDTSCLLFITLYLTVRNAPNFPIWRILLLIFLLVMAVLIRSQAILLLVAEVILLALSLIKSTVQKQRLSVIQSSFKPAVYIIAGTLVVNFILNKLVFNAPVPASSFYNQFIQQIIHGDIKNMADAQKIRLLPDIASFFYHDDEMGISFVQSVVITFTAVGFTICIANRLATDDLFFVLMCLLIVFLPVHDPRYFLPAIPLLFFYCYTTFKVILPRITKLNGRWVGIVLTLIYLRMGYGNLKEAAKIVPAGMIPQTRDLAAFRYISQHINDNDVILFTKPRLLTLYTGKKSINTAWQIPMTENKHIFDSVGVKYVLIVDGLDDSYYKDYMKQVQHPTDSVRIADGYTVYSLR